MSKPALLQEVESDIREWLKVKSKQPFFNEKDMQLNLAQYLGEKNYTDIIVEYPLSIDDERMADYLALWVSDVRNKRIYIDVIVEKEGQFVLVELKFKTRKDQINATLFGSDILMEFSNQGQINIAKYLFWKDVHRIELIKEAYQHIGIVGGVAVFMTNNTTYQNAQEGTDVEAFSMNETDKSTPEKFWPPEKDEWHKKNGQPSFKINKEYPVKWVKSSKFSGAKYEFETLIVSVN